MPFPGGLNTITVTATYADGADGPINGTVTFTPAADLTDAAGNLIVRAAPISARVIAGVMTAQVLLCTDSAAVSPSGWTWNIAEYLSNANANAASRSYSVLLPHTLGATVDLSALSPTVPQAGITSYLLATNNLSDLQSPAAARTNLGLGSAATSSASAFDAAGAAATAQSAAQSFATSAVNTETTRAQAAEALLAPLASPALTGTPTAPTKPALTSNTDIATTAYTDAAVTVETTRAQTAEALKAPLASPALTGSPTAPTQTAGDNSTKLATDAFVTTAVATETTRATAAEATKLTASSNLSDVANPATSRTNLSAAASGANADITSLTGLTTPLPVSEGGTAAASGPAAQVALGGVSWFNVQAPAYGAKGNGNMVTDASVTATSATLTSATANFTSGDVGKLVQVRGAGTSGADLNTTISAFTNATTVTLAVAAGTTVSAAQCVYASDDAAACQAAITAAQGVYYGTVYFPPGIYMWSTAVSISKCMRITANGALIVTTNSGALNLTNTFLSPTPGVFGRGNGLVIEGLELDCTGGHNIYNVNLSNFSWRDLVLTQRSSNFAAVYHDQTGTNFIGGDIRNVLTYVYGSARTMQAWHLVSHVGGGLALTKWTRCLFQNQGVDTAQYLVWTEARGGTNYTNGLEFDSCVLTSATGGGMAFWSAQGVVLQNCRVVNSNNTANGNSVYRIGTNTGSGVSTYTSQGITITGCGRDLPGPNGTSTWDVQLDSTVDLVVIQGFECRWRAQDTAQTPFFNLGGATHVLILDCPTAVLSNAGNAIQIPLTGDANTPATGDGAASFGSLTITTPLPIGSGGTGAGTQQAALDAIAGATTSGQMLRGNGTHVQLAALQAGDVPTLNQSTTGTASNVTGIVAIANGGSGQATQQAAINALTGTQSAGKVLRSDGTNATLAAIQAADLPAASTSAQGAVVIDGTATDITALGAQAAGAIGKAADAGHVHPTTGVVTTVNGASGAVTAAYPLAVIAKQTGNYPAAANQYVPCDTTGGALTVTLPTAPADRTMVGIKHVIQGSTNAVTFTCGGSDVINKAGGPTSGTLTLVNQAVLLIYASAAGAWYVAADDLPLTDLDARYVLVSALPLAIASGGTGQATAAAAYNALTPMTTLGDLPYESAANTASRLAGNTTAVKNFLTQTGTGSASAAPAWGTIAAGDVPANGNVQTFTASGTWTKPASATQVTVICIGAGGGGGSGAVEASGTVASGGAGGGGGGFTIKTIPAALLSSSETVTVSATGGTGGIAVGTTASAGNAGGAGGASSFKSTAWAVANGGAGGGAGTTGAATGGTGGVGSINGGTGASSSASGAAGGTGSGSNQGASGGGAGGGIATTPASVAGGAGGIIQSSSGNVGGLGGTSGGGTGGAGTSVTANAPVAGTGGGGGGSLVAGTGGTGGAGGTYGGGGGGGAGATTGQTSGAGGTGAGGLVVVISLN